MKLVAIIVSHYWQRRRRRRKDFLTWREYTQMYFVYEESIEIYWGDLVSLCLKSNVRGSKHRWFENGKCEIKKTGKERIREKYETDF